MFKERFFIFNLSGKPGEGVGNNPEQQAPEPDLKPELQKAVVEVEGELQQESIEARQPTLNAITETLIAKPEIEALNKDTKKLQKLVASIPTRQYQGKGSEQGKEYSKQSSNNQRIILQF